MKLIILSKRDRAFGLFGIVLVIVGAGALAWVVIKIWSALIGLDGKIQQQQTNTPPDIVWFQSQANLPSPSQVKAALLPGQQIIGIFPVTWESSSNGSDWIVEPSINAANLMSTVRGQAAAALLDSSLPLMKLYRVQQPTP